MREGGGGGGRVFRSAYLPHRMNDELFMFKKKEKKSSRWVD